MSRNFGSSNLLRWLTLYLLVILAILLLVLNLVGVPAKIFASTTATPTPTSKSSPKSNQPPAGGIKNTPSLISMPTSLVKEPIVLTLQNVETKGLLDNSQSAISKVQKDCKTQVKLQTGLKNHRAALVIVYGTAVDSASTSTAKDVASKVIAALQSLSPKEDVFSDQTVYHSAYIIGDDPNVVELDVYLFAKP